MTAKLSLDSEHETENQSDDKPEAQVGVSVERQVL
jgi:hypothetical protein